MKLPNIANTISFKLSALYLLLFLCSFLSIGLTVYLLTSHTLEQQLKSTIDTESIRLKTEYDSGGIADLHEGTLSLFDNKPGLKIVLSLRSK